MEKYVLLMAAVIGISALGWYVLRLLPGKSMIEEVWPRLYAWLVVIVMLFTGLHLIAPEQAQVVYYKFALVIAAAYLGYWIDRILFPYSRPDGYLKKFWQHGTDEPEDKADHEVVEGYKNVFCFAMIRRALIVIAVTLSATLGL